MALLTDLAESVEEIRQQRRQTLEEMQQVAIELSMAATSWLVGAAIDADQFAVDDLIRTGMARLDLDDAVQVELNPADHDLLQRLLEESPDPGLVERITVIRDSALPRGSCRISSGRKSLVSDLESRLEAIHRSWLENMDDSQIERRRNGRDGRTLRRFPERRETA
ncbi:MAG: hypothetical protein KDA96_10095 [Planctomycetaceae bacterium]|nr:hypothetical protein [Planctomycetaceae bacterium]